MKKKIASLVLAAAMVFSMSTTVFAEEVTEAQTQVAAETTDDVKDANVNDEAKAERTTNEEEQLVGKKSGNADATGTVDLSTISYSSRLRNAGDTVVIRLKTANVKRLHFYFSYKATDGKEKTFSTTSFENSKGNAVYDEMTGYWTLTVNLPDDAATGVMYLDDIQMIDQNEKYSYVWDNNQFSWEDSADLSPYYISIGGVSLPSSAGRTVPHCTLNTAAGETWDGTYYKVNGEVKKDVFFFDGAYTYYLQANGTPMKSRLTYHPNGVAVIYFDENGHEVFNSFVNVKQSITGEAVDDICYFDASGYMYQDKLTYGQNGDSNLYYINPCGVMQRGGYFTFPNGDLGYAEANGALMTNQDSYSPAGALVHFDGMGHAKQ